MENIFESFIGLLSNWGQFVMDFYNTFSLWINGLVILYAMIVTIAWRNYNTVHIHILNKISDQLNKKIKTWSKSEVNTHLSSIEIPWVFAVEKIRIPIIARTGSLRLFRVSLAAIEKMFPRDEFINSLKNMEIKKEK